MARILRCPRTHSPLDDVGDTLKSRTGETYPVIKGIPILVRTIETLHTASPDANLVAKSAASFSGPPSLPADALILHLGCGGVPSSDPRVISLDILPIDCVDVVAEAEELPFRTNSLDHIVASAVFEHVYDPAAASTEIRRVLKPGGTFRIETAFNQTHKGFPGHFYNMTAQAAETLLIDDFELLRSAVPDNGSVTHTLTGLLRRLIRTLPADSAKHFSRMTVDELLEALNADRSKTNPLFSSFSEYSHRAMAASHSVSGRKPANYEIGRRKAAQQMGPDAWARLKRSYYASRATVVLRHHEIELYRDRCLAVGKEIPDLPPLSPLNHYLQLGSVKDPMVPQNWRTACEKLDQFTANLTTIRNRWIRRWQAP